MWGERGRSASRRVSISTLIGRDAGGSLGGQILLPLAGVKKHPRPCRRFRLVTLRVRRTSNSLTAFHRDDRDNRIRPVLPGPADSVFSATDAVGPDTCLSFITVQRRAFNYGQQLAEAPRDAFTEITLKTPIDSHLTDRFDRGQSLARGERQTFAWRSFHRRDVENTRKVSLLRFNVSIGDDG